MDAGTTEQPAPTIHQSLIWNNSAPDSSHKINSKQMISLTDNDSDLGPVPRSQSQLLHLFNPGLTLSVYAFAWASVCVWASYNSFTTQFCVSLGGDWQGVSVVEKIEALISTKGLWQTRECFENKDCLYSRRKSYTGRKSDRPRNELWIPHV